MSIDLVNTQGLPFFMFTDDLAYKQLSESSKNYSLQKYIRDTKMGKHQADSAETILSKNYIGMILAKIMDHYWKTQIDFSVVDIGTQYCTLSIPLANYIKSHRNSNKIYAFDCGLAGRLAEYNIKLNQLHDIITFEYKAVSNASIPHLVYYDSEHSEDNHIVKRDLVNLPSCIVDGITLDDYFNNNNKNLILKIDAQGAEPLVFEGMQKILHDVFPAVIFKFIPWVCRSITEPAAFLNSLPGGYIFFNIDSKNNRLQKLTRNEFAGFVATISVDNPPYTNILMLHETIANIDNLINDIFKISV